MDERAFYSEVTETRTASLNCPYCQTRGDYSLRWLIRRKRPGAPVRLDPADAAKFRKAASYMVLLDDHARCGNSRCRRNFEISGIKTTAFLEEN